MPKQFYTLALVTIASLFAAWQAGATTEGYICNTLVANQCDGGTDTVSSAIDRDDSTIENRQFDVYFDFISNESDFCKYTFSIAHDIVQTGLLWPTITIESGAGTPPDVTAACSETQFPSGTATYPQNKLSWFCRVEVKTGYPDEIPIRDNDFEVTVFPTLWKNMAATGTGHGVELTDVSAWKWNHATQQCASQNEADTLGGIVAYETDSTSCASDGDDADGDGFCDNLDNCTGARNIKIIGKQYQRDDDSDGYGNPCDWDVDQNCAAGGTDLSAVFNHFGDSPTNNWGGDPIDAAMDIDHLAQVNAVGGEDLSKVFGTFGAPLGAELRRLQRRPARGRGAQGRRSRVRVRLGKPVSASSQRWCGATFRPRTHRPNREIACSENTT